MKQLQEYSLLLAQQAKEAAHALRQSSADQRTLFLKELAEGLVRAEIDILSANQSDVLRAQQAGLSLAMIDRLTLNSKRLQGISQSVREIANLPDPLSKTLSSFTRPDGLKVSRQSVPIGTLLFIFESRPNVTIDGAALCIKSGNSVILRGGKESLHSNLAFAKVISQSLEKADLPIYAVQLVNQTEHEVVDHLLTLNQYIDIVIPRGGEKLIESVVAKSKIPVIKHYKGVCHVYIDATANLKKACDIVLNAKVQRPGVCNAMETLLLDSQLETDAVKELLVALKKQKVELRVCPKIFQKTQFGKLANEEDWDTEYLDLILSVKEVTGVSEAVAHIQTHGTGHTDAIVSESKEAQEIFLNGLDSSSVMVNASTRFADGGEYGLGAEVGISTDKLHARGPMGIESLTTYQWRVVGDGHIRS